MNSFHKPVEELLEQDVKPSTIEAVKTLRVLIIEEISMVENQFLERLDMLMRFIMRKDAPGAAFGGKQVIIVGDFHQVRIFLSRFLSTSEQYLNDRWKGSSISCSARNLTNYSRRKEDSMLTKM